MSAAKWPRRLGGSTPTVISQSGLFSSPERRSFPNFQRLDLGGLIGRPRSASYVPTSGAGGERLVSLLSGLYGRYADGSGFVTLVYEPVNHVRIEITILRGMPRGSGRSPWSAPPSRGFPA
jgi:hypothetical protein